MVLDPISALSLASSVIQFVDFGSRLLSKGKEYYKSADGALVEHKDLRAIASNISKLTDGLDQSLSKFDSGQAPTSADTALQDITLECKAKAEQFVQVVDGLMQSGPHTKWNSFRQAFKSLWKTEEMDKMLARLSMLREQMMLNLLVVMNNRRADEVKTMLSSQDKMEKSILRTVEQAGNEIKKEISNLSSILAQTSQSDRNAILDHWQAANRDEVARMMFGLAELTERENIRKMTNGILASLYFSQLEDRYARIPIAHEETFRWIYEHPPEDVTDWSDFVSWLENGGDSRDVYWVSGKAGSGKSTLMRYLSDEQKTRYHLQKWHGQKQLLFATCFFWNPGTAIQKSLNGLLRSLLYQLLQQSSKVVPLVAPERWRALSLGATKLEEWMDTELLSTLDNFMRETSSHVSVCIFVDGLDEFDGNDQRRLQVIELFRKLARMSNAKICLSSRPWLIFQDEFADCPKLRLERLTRNDIRRYVEARLATAQRFQLLRQSASLDCTQLIERTSEKAEGVFLWVYLVTQSLLEGLRDGDNMLELSATLDSFPSDLETFFRHMMTTIETKHRPEAAKLFRLVLDYYESEPEEGASISLMTVSFIAEQDPEFALKMPIHALTISQLEERLESASRRLNSRCKGFLEVYSEDTANSGDIAAPAPIKRIDFLHRTVKDFLLTKDMQDMLELHCKGSYDQKSYLCSSFLAQVKMIMRKPVRGPDWFDVDEMVELVQNFVRYAREIEVCTVQDSKEIEELVRAISIYKESGKREAAMDVQWWREWGRWDDPLLYFAITEDLAAYVLPRLSGDPALVTQVRTRPLLDFALRRYLQETECRTAPNPLIVSEMLKQPRALLVFYQGIPVWQHFLNILEDVGKKTDDSYWRKWIRTTQYQLWIETSRIVREATPPGLEVPRRNPFVDGTGQRVQHVSRPWVPPKPAVTSVADEDVIPWKDSDARDLDLSGTLQTPYSLGYEMYDSNSTTANRNELNNLQQFPRSAAAVYTPSIQPQFSGSAAAVYTPSIQQQFSRSAAAVHTPNIPQQFSGSAAAVYTPSIQQQTSRPRNEIPGQDRNWNMNNADIPHQPYKPHYEASKSTWNESPTEQQSSKLQKLLSLRRFKSKKVK